MGPYSDGFESWLLKAGYTPGTVRNVLKLMGQLGRWMEGSDVEVAQLDAAAVDAFRRFCRDSGGRRVPGPRSLSPLLGFLRSEGVLVVVETATMTPVEEIVGNYGTWLVVDRGLADQTVLRYERVARRFLEERAAEDGDRAVENLTGAHVTAFLLKETARVSVGSAKGRVAELRSLLRFFYLKGLTSMALATAVPPVAGWHGIGIPVGLSTTEIERLVESCDRSDPGGIRDYAILKLVSRLGLRSVEVARLEVGDIDWRVGEIVVRGKARRLDRMPLPHDVGEALTAYLCEARQPTAIRKVFLARKAPMRAIRPDLVSDVTRRACDRAGVQRVGAHRLRHGLATDMLGRGATLVEVSQILRHRDLATTAIYAKVDIATLRHVAQPWPGAAK